MVVAEETKATMESLDDRWSELKAFDETKLGVKGVVDSGATKVPRIFINQSQNADSIIEPDNAAGFGFPVIDLADGLDKHDPLKRERIVEEIRDASEKWGFFQVVNHGIPTACLEEMLDGVRRFNEQDPDIKKHYYSRDFTKAVGYYSNFDLYISPAANWKDSFHCVMAPESPPPEDLPAACSTVFPIAIKVIASNTAASVACAASPLTNSGYYYSQMEHCDHIFSAINNISDTPPDLVGGITEEVDVANMHEDQNGVSGFLITEHIQVPSANSIIEQLESRLVIGQVVRSVEDAYLLYCNYAHAKGFSVKKGDQRYFPGTSELQAKDFECSCEGGKDEKCSSERIPVYLKPITRTKCKAKLRITRQHGG
ncbi:1-aminocyclopropane-1-carboxylate oxidase homolog isoform X2 [Henckelia pumila]|uniref:1-aminocyclopropane-1-carboxylate oxidase homolog isoform X2 n=1 Tax=Henckelia pumila TaxID=405737 RepID=UPI003C6E851A